MKATCRILIASLVALAGCGSTRTSPTFRSAPVPPVAEQQEKKQEVPPADTTKKTTTKTKAAKNYGPFRVSLLLPLEISAAQGCKMHSVIGDYYEGILLGLDSLKNAGLNIVVDVYDTKDDSATVKKITWKTELAESHLIIGPTFSKGHAMLSKYVASRKIALVSPFSNANMWSDSNNYSMYFTPTEKAYATRLANYISTHYPNANLLLFNDGSKDDKDFLWRFKVAARDTGLSQWKDITFQESWNIAAHLKKGDSVVNIIIAPTDDDAIAAKLLTQLKETDYNNKLFVLESWMDFKNLNYQSYQLWQQNNLHVLTSFFVEEDDLEVMQFKSLYKRKYGAYPNDFAYRGYDHILSLGTAFLNGGKEALATSVTQTEEKGLHNNSRFYFNGKALENTAVNIIEFKDYRFRRVRE